jgi:hypothetical protein
MGSTNVTLSTCHWKGVSLEADSAPNHGLTWILIAGRVNKGPFLERAAAIAIPPHSGGERRAIDVVAENGRAGVPRTRRIPNVSWTSGLTHGFPPGPEINLCRPSQSHSCDVVLDVLRRLVHRQGLPNVHSGSHLVSIFKTDMLSTDGHGSLRIRSSLIWSKPTTFGQDHDDYHRDCAYHERERSDG